MRERCPTGGARFCVMLSSMSVGLSELGAHAKVVANARACLGEEGGPALGGRNAAGEQKTDANGPHGTCCHAHSSLSVRGIYRSIHGSKTCCASARASRPYVRIARFCTNRGCCGCTASNIMYFKVRDLLRSIRETGKLQFAWAILLTTAQSASHAVR